MKSSNVKTIFFVPYLYKQNSCTMILRLVFRLDQQGIDLLGFVLVLSQLGNEEDNDMVKESSELGTQLIKAQRMVDFFVFTSNQGFVDFFKRRLLSSMKILFILLTWVRTNKLFLFLIDSGSLVQSIDSPARPDHLSQLTYNCLYLNG